MKFTGLEKVGRLLNYPGWFRHSDLHLVHQAVESTCVPSDVARTLGSLTQDRLVTREIRALLLCAAEKKGWVAS